MFKNRNFKEIVSWQTVLGFEVHIELETSSKMFCCCPADHFGKAPNTQVCPVCLGLPGTLPVPNARAIEWCIKLGLALGCQVNLFSKFDRKNYFYPDLPKGYQITQYNIPFCHDGELLGHKITRVHLEEDTAKLQHQENMTLIDFNRSGVPLVEVVTEADFKDSDDSDVFLKELQQIIRALGISSADMEKGSMRLEANISIKRPEHPDLPDYKVEVKNVNSFKFIKKAIDYEVTRQIQLLESGQIPVQETRGFKESTGETVSQRAKEEANDYRYFPEPDIPPLQFTEAQIESWRSELPVLPARVREELVNRYQLSSRYAVIISSDPDMYAKFLKNPSKATANALVNKRPLQTTQSAEVDREVVSKVLIANPKAVADLKSGKQQALFFLIGQIKKELGDVDVALVKRTVEELI